MRAHPVLAEPVDRADEGHDELVRGVLVEVARLAGLLDLALVHEDDPVGDVHRLLLVVRDQHGRHVDVVVQAAQPGAELLADAGVERAERLVQQQHLGLDGQSARQGHPLALPAGELRRVPLGEPVQLHEVEQLVDALADRRLRLLADREPEADVVAHGHVLERRVVLEDEADAAILRRHAGRVLAGDDDVARVRASRARRSRAGASTCPLPRGPEQRGQRARRDGERHVVERQEAAEALSCLPDRYPHVPPPCARSA